MAHPRHAHIYFHHHYPQSAEVHYSDVIVKSGNLMLRAHRVILAQHSVYFRRAFLGQFSVASSPVINLDEDDKPELIRAMIKFMYGHRKIDYRSTLVDMFILADKYDVKELRDYVCAQFTGFLPTRLGVTVDAHWSHQSHFINYAIPTICGPSAVQLADKRLRRSILHICKVHSRKLLLDSDFCTLYGTGQLFDDECAAEFGQHLALSLVQGRRFALPRLPLYTDHSRPSFAAFFNNEAFSDVVITWGDGQKIFAHKIILSIQSSFFSSVLEASASTDIIDLGKDDDSALVRAILHELYDPVNVTDRGTEPERMLFFSANMYLLHQKYGLKTSANRHRDEFLELLDKAKLTSTYAFGIALVCGPDSDKFTETTLPESAFMHCLKNALYLLRDDDTFVKMLNEGTLLNAKYAGRFAIEVWLTMKQVARW